MRHGLAENEFDSDFTRALSKTGETQALSAIGQLLAKESNLPKAMLVSPFKRTQQTADLVHQKLALKQAYQTEELLVHFADHQLLGEFLLASNHEDLIIVSHMPIVASLCQYLSPGCDIFGFQTAQIVKLEFDSSRLAKVTNIYYPK